MNRIEWLQQNIQNIKDMEYPEPSDLWCLREYEYELEKRLIDEKQEVNAW